jgi:hypothetical protein
MNLGSLFRRQPNTAQADYIRRTVRRILAPRLDDGHYSDGNAVMLPQGDIITCAHGLERIHGVGISPPTEFSPELFYPVHYRKDSRAVDLAHFRVDGPTPEETLPLAQRLPRRCLDPLYFVGQKEGFEGPVMLPARYQGLVKAFDLREDLNGKADDFGVNAEKFRITVPALEKALNFKGKGFSGSGVVQLTNGLPRLAGLVIASDITEDKPNGNGTFVAVSAREIAKFLKIKA